MACTYFRGLCRAALIVGISCICTAWAQAAPKADQVLPATTKGLLVVPSVDVLKKHWDRTQIGQLAADERMRPFVEDFRRQWNERLSESGRRLGLTWDDLEGVPGGEVAFALIQPAADQGARAILVDITGHQPQTDALLAKVDANLLKQGAKKSTPSIEGTAVVAYDLPRHEGDNRASQALFVVKSNTLVACDNVAVLTGILQRWDRSTGDQLAATKAYQEVMKRCAARATDTPAQVRWFLEPFGFVQASRFADPGYKPRRGTDLLAVLKASGFDAIQGLGGYVSFSVSRYELLHRTVVYAPPAATANTKAGDKYVLGARVLNLPNVSDLAAQKWVPRDLAAVQTVNVKLDSAFAGFGSLVDGMAKEAVFEDIIRDIKENADGPQIDVQREIVARLGTRVTIMTDYEHPITPKSERTVLAIETRDEPGLRSAVDRAMGKNPQAKKRVFGDAVIWEVIDEAEELAPAAVDVPGVGPAAPAEEKSAEDEDAFKMRRSAVMVTRGHLFRSSHVDLLVKVLKQTQAPQSMTDAVDYQLVQAELEKLGAGQHSCRFFSRTDEEVRPTYELIKAKKMPISETGFGRVLNRVFGDPKSKKPREQKIDGKELPDYDMVRRHLGPSGGFVNTLDDGWFITGFLLPKQSPPVEVGMK